MKVLIACIAMLAMASAVSQTQWTLNELSAAIQDPATDPQMLPYLEAALNELMAQIWHGADAGSIAVDMPIAAPIDVMPVMPEVIPVEQSPVPSTSSPLVQIILNIAA